MASASEAGLETVPSMKGDDDVLSLASHVEKEKKTTIQEPFNLTKPKPKVIPQPEALKREVIANPVDKRIYKHTLAGIEKDKEMRRKATVDNIRKEYESNDKKRFNLATEKLPSIVKNDQVIKEVNEMIEKEIKFEGTKPRAMPNFEKYNAPVKLNAASVMREGLAIKKF